MIGLLGGAISSYGTFNRFPCHFRAYRRLGTPKLVELF